MKDEGAEGMPCLEAEPESWQAGGCSFIGGTTSVSSGLCGAKARLIPADNAALARGNNGRRRSITLQGISLGASAPRSLGYWRDDRCVVRFSRG
jgi:hypothetical protein